MPRLRVEGRRRAASRSIAIETPKSAPRAHPAHRPQPPSQEDALLREQIDKHGGPGNWTAIAEALVGRSSKSCRLRCARPRTRSRARDAAGIAACSPRARPATPHRPARAFPGLILDRHPRRPPASPRVPYRSNNRSRCSESVLVIPSAQVVQPAQPLGEARAVHRGGGQENPRRARRVRQQVGGHLPRHPRQVRQRHARHCGTRLTKVRARRTVTDRRLARTRSVLSSRRAEPSFWRLPHPTRDDRAFLLTHARGSIRSFSREKSPGRILVSLFRKSDECASSPGRGLFERTSRSSFVPDYFSSLPLFPDVSIADRTLLTRLNIHPRRVSSPRSSAGRTTR